MAMVPISVRAAMAAEIRSMGNSSSDWNEQSPAYQRAQINSTENPDPRQSSIAFAAMQSATHPVRASRAADGRAP